MDAEAFRTALTAHALTQQRAGRLFEVDERTVRRWSTGAAEVPRSVALVFALMARFSLTPDDL